MIIVVFVVHPGYDALSGFRYGEAEHPGPRNHVNYGAVLEYTVDDIQNWSQSYLASLNVGTLYDSFASSSTAAYLRAQSEQLVPNSAPTGVVERVALADSGAVGLLSGFEHEFDNLEESNIVWSSASTDNNTVDFVGDYRLFLPNHDYKYVYFTHLWGLCVRSMGNVELFGVCQLNRLGVGFASPPVSWNEAPFLFHGTPSDIQAIHRCRILPNGLPHIGNIHTQEALLLLRSGYRLKSLADGSDLNLASVIPALADALSVQADSTRRVTFSDSRPSFRVVTEVQTIMDSVASIRTIENNGGMGDGNGAKLRLPSRPKVNSNISPIIEFRPICGKINQRAKHRVEVIH